MGQANRTLPTSEHFKLDRIAEGVYVAIAIEGGLARCNAGIVDLGDQTLLFDTFMTPQAAQDLRAAAEGLTGRPVTYVINSHAHSDHWPAKSRFDLVLFKGVGTIDLCLRRAHPYTADTGHVVIYKTASIPRPEVAAGQQAAGKLGFVERPTFDYHLPAGDVIANFSLRIYAPKSHE